VLASTGWQTHPRASAKGLRKIDPALAPVSTALGVLGMPGMTAYTGLLNIGAPKPGETLVVAAASGAVGSAVGQIGRIKGCRVIGIAGGEEKTRYIREELGFDVALDHRAADFGDRLKAACPDGIDIYFETVGGQVWELVRPLLNNFARVPVCGLIAQYNGVPGGGAGSAVALRSVLVKRLRIQGFIVSDFAAQRDDFLRDMGAWVASGQVKYREDVVEGIDNAVPAFLGLLQGRNFGKLLIRPRGLPRRLAPTCDSVPLDSASGLWNKKRTIWIMLLSCVWDRHIRLRGAETLALPSLLSTPAGAPRGCSPRCATTSRGWSRGMPSSSVRRAGPHPG
jgi:hypothetical protein